MSFEAFFFFLSTKGEEVSFHSSWACRSPGEWKMYMLLGPQPWGQGSAGLFLHPSKNICVQKNSWSAVARSRFTVPGEAPSLEAAPRRGLCLEERCSKNIEWGFEGLSSAALPHANLVHWFSELGFTGRLPPEFLTQETKRVIRGSRICICKS